MLPNTPAPLTPKSLVLTQEEVFALLEMCVLTLAPEQPLHLGVLSRLSSLHQGWEEHQGQPTRQPTNPITLPPTNVGFDPDNEKAFLRCLLGT